MKTRIEARGAVPASYLEAFRKGEGKNSFLEKEYSGLTAEERGADSSDADLSDFSEEGSGTDSEYESEAVSRPATTEESDSPVNNIASVFSGLSLFPQPGQGGKREPLLNEAGVELVRHPLNNAS